MLPGRRKQIKRYRRKFDYHKKDYSNPLFRHKKKRKVKLAPLTWRAKLIILEVMVLTAGIIWFCCFSSYFAIGTIDVIGAEKISTQDIKDLAWQQTEYRRFLIGSQENLFLYNKNKLIKTLNEQYCLDGLVIEKKLPNIIIIKFKEKIYSVIWLQSDKYYYIDTEGNIISETNPLEIEQKDYPLIDYQGENKILDQKIKNQNENIDFIVKLHNEFKIAASQRISGLEKIGDKFKIERFIINNEFNTIKMIINEGPEVYFNTREDSEKQVTKLLVLINEKLKDDFYKKTYIDLRYGDRVYYR